MKMAYIDPTGIVVGMLDGDTARTYTPQDGYVLRVAEDAKVGDVWAGSTYVPRIDADNHAALITKGRAYLALSSPTAAQTTKAVRALVMLAINELSSLSGT